LRPLKNPQLTGQKIAIFNCFTGFSTVTSSVTALVSPLQNTKMSKSIPRQRAAFPLPFPFRPSPFLSPPRMPASACRHQQKRIARSPAIGQLFSHDPCLFRPKTSHALHVGCFIKRQTISISLRKRPSLSPPVIHSYKDSAPPASRRSRGVRTQDSSRPEGRISISSSVIFTFYAQARQCLNRRIFLSTRRPFHALWLAVQQQ